MTGLDALNKKTKTLTVAFIGGSITEGTDRATKGCYYVDIVGDYFKKYYIEQDVTIINAGWGGTGSEFGLFRLCEDVIKYNPDMVFVEFAANDILKTPYETKLYMENIVTNLMSMEKIPVINFIYTTDDKYNQMSEVHEEIASHYGIPSINIMEYVKSEVMCGRIQFTDIFGDHIHPNDVGYKLYSDFIISCIFNNTEKYFKLPDKTVPRLIPREIENPTFDFPSADMVTGNFSLRKKVNCHLPAAFALSKGSILSYEFYGDYIGVICEDMYEDGVVECIIDGQSCGLVRPIPYSPSYINDTLTKSPHKLELISISDKPFCIAAFMINHEINKED